MQSPILQKDSEYYDASNPQSATLYWDCPASLHQSDPDTSKMSQINMPSTLTTVDFLLLFTEKEAMIVVSCKTHLETGMQEY